MGLGKLLTRILPCSSAPKSPTPPNSPNQENEGARPKTKTDTLVEVTPCLEITSKDLEGSSPQPVDKAGSPLKEKNGAATLENVHQLKKSDPKSPQVTEAAGDASEKLILDVFGFDILRQLQGKAWDERGQAVQSIRTQVAQSGNGHKDILQFFRACSYVSQIALKDKVMPVFFDGLELTKLLLGDFAVSHEMPKVEVTACLDLLLPVIVGKSSDRNARSIEGTRQALVFLAQAPAVGCQPVMAHILVPIANAKEVAFTRGKLELLHHMIGEFGFSKSTTLTLSTVMGFVRPHLDAPDEKVRRAAVEVTVSCYSRKGERTLKYCSNLKPALLKLLEQRFAEVDSKGSAKKSHKSKTRKSSSRKTPSSRGSGSSSRGSGKATLAPLEVTPYGRVGDSGDLVADLRNREESRGSNQSGLSGPMDDENSLHAELFAPQSHTGLRLSPNRTPTLAPGLPMQDAGIASPQYGISIDPVGNSSLAMHEDPNYIPSPTEQQPSSSKFSVDDDAFMDEIENL